MCSLLKIVIKTSVSYASAFPVRPYIPLSGQPDRNTVSLASSGFLFEYFISPPRNRTAAFFHDERR